MDYVSGVANVGLYASHHSSPSDYDHMAEMAVPPPQEVPLSPFCHPLSNSAEDVSFATNTTSLLLPDDIDNGNNDENASQTNLVLFGNDDNTQLISSDYPEEQGFPLLTTSSRGVSGFDVSQHASATPQPDQQQLTLCSQQQQLQGYAYGTLSHVLTGRPATSSTSAFQHYHRQQQQQQQPNCFNAFFRRQQSTTLSGPPATVSVSSRNLTFLRTPSLEHATTTMASNDTVLHTRRLSLESTKHLSQRATAIMEGWYSANTDSPYPSKREKEIIAKAGGITVEQVGVIDLVRNYDGFLISLYINTILDAIMTGFKPFSTIAWLLDPQFSCLFRNDILEFGITE